jgi:NAD(P)-dependent dehydrogenase (short-subunit alcohol dehydrogenase family)
MSKAATNTAVAMYSAIYKQEGILFMSIHPGVVDTGHVLALNDEQRKMSTRMYAKFAEMKPGFRVLSPEELARMCLDVADTSSIERGDGGTFVSQYCNRDWL